MRFRNRQRGYLLATVVVTLFLIASIAVLLTHESSVSANTASRELETARAEYVAQAALQHALWRVENSACMGDMSISDTALGADSYQAIVTGAAAGTFHTFNADQDAWIRDDQPDNNNNSADSHIRFETGKTEHALTRFDISTLPANAQINSAVAWFYVKNGNGEHPEGPLTVHRVTADWTETGATWDTMGGKFESGALASVPAQDHPGTWVSFNLTGQVQAWVNGQPNYGILMASIAEGVHAQYVSREGSEPPRLEVVVGEGAASPVAVEAIGTLANGNTRSLARPNPAALQPRNTMVIQPDEANGTDSYIWQDGANTNFGDDDEGWVCLGGGSNTCASLFRFNIAEVPEGAKVLGATLSLHHRSGYGNDVPITAHRIMQSWNEAFVTWNDRDYGTSWITPGGDFDSAVIATTNVGPASDTRYEWDITNLVQDWMNGTYANYGVALVTAQNGSDGERFYTSSDSQPARRPRLTISYACECGVPCMAPRGTGTIMLVIDNVFSPNDDDKAKKETFESWGYEVNYYDDDTWSSIFDSGFQSHDVVYVSESSSASKLGDKLTYAPIGVVSEEGELNDNFGFASGSGSPVGKDIAVIDSGHYITSIFSGGTLDIYELPMQHLTASGTTSAGAQVLATIDTADALIAMNPGAEMQGGGTTAGRRVMLPVGAVSGFDWRYMTNDGALIVQRAIDWSINSYGLRLLMVVGEDNNLTEQEAAKKSLIESWGYEVTVIDEDDNQSAFDDALAENDVVFVGEDVRANDVDNKLTDATIGVVIEEANLVDDLGMGDGIDWDSGDKITIITAAHYITQPFDTGTMAILDSNESLAYQIPNQAPGLKVLGRSSSGPTLTAIDATAELVSGGPAAGRRVLLPWGGNNMDVNHLNDNGLMLFRRALEWGAGAEFDNGLVAHWKLDETSGTTAVDSEGGHDGTLLNGPVWSAGVMGGSVHFSDETHAISAPHSGSLTITGDLTLLAWVNLDELRPNRPIVQKGTSNIDHNYYFGLSNDAMQFAVSPPEGGWHVKGSGATGISPGSWRHLAVSFNDSTDEVAFYLDGALFATQELTHSPSEFAGPVRIGRNDNNYGIKGRIDDVRIYRRVLAAGEIADLFDAARTIPEAHWKLDETSGSTAIDSTGGHDGTLTNGPVWTAGEVDGGLDFDGVDDYVDLTSDFGLTNIFAGGATVTAWIYPRGWGESENARILDKASAVSGNRDGWMIGLRGEDAALQFAQGFTGTRGFWRSQEDTITLNEWVHVAVVYDASSVANDAAIYLDGVLQTPLVEITPTGTIASDEGIPLRMGNYAQDTSRTFSGIIDDVRIFDRMLNATEVAELAASGGSPPVAHWMLDEGTGSTAIDSAGDHDGTLANGPVWVAGQLGDALRFDGSNDRINVPHQPSLNLVASMTLSAWVNADSLKPYQMVLTKGDNGVYENYWLGAEGNKVNFGFVAGGTYYQHTTSGLTLNAGTWHHIAATYDDAANEVKIYVDGVDETFSTPGTPVVNAQKLIIGNSYYGGEGFDGTIDDVRIYNGVLSATEIANLAAEGGGGGGGGGGCSGTFRDEFNAVSYSGNDGTENWSGPWSEINENGNVSSGDERVTDNDSQYHLQVRDNDGGGEGVQREADLSAYTTATFSFEYRRDGFDNGNDYVMVHVSNNGGASWTELGRFTGPGTDSSYISASYDISTHISSNTRIRFLTSPNHGSGDELYIDNVEIAVSGCAGP